MMLGISLMGYGKEIDEWQDFGSDSNGINYQVKFNEHGAILKNNETLELIYLGKSYDVYSRKYGNGKWKNTDNYLGDLYIEFNSNKIKFSGSYLRYVKTYTNDTFSGNLMLIEEGFQMDGKKEGFWYEYSAYDYFFSTPTDSFGDYRGTISSKRYYINDKLKYEYNQNGLTSFVARINYDDKEKIVSGLVYFSELNKIKDKYFYKGKLYTGDYFKTEHDNQFLNGEYIEEIIKLGSIKNGNFDGKQIYFENLNDIGTMVTDENITFNQLYKELKLEKDIVKIENYNNGKLVN